MSLYDGRHHLSIRVIWQDDELVEIEGRVITDRWSGNATSYTTFAEIRQFARELSRFNLSLAGEACLEAGAEEGYGLVAMRFYTIDAARHVACYLRLGTSGGHRAEQTCKLAIEVTTEPTFIEGFAKGLERMADEEAREAVLILE